MVCSVAELAHETAGILQNPPTIAFLSSYHETAAAELVGHAASGSGPKPKRKKAGSAARTKTPKFSRVAHNDNAGSRPLEEQGMLRFFYKGISTELYFVQILALRICRDKLSHVLWRCGSKIALFKS